VSIDGRLAVPYERLAAFCRQHHIRKLAFFGSVLTPAFRPDSDIDVLVEFEAGYVPGFRFVDLEDELSALLGRRVDLHTAATLSPYFRDRVVGTANPVYQS
jgi:hypothetical protein